MSWQKLNPIKAKIIGCATCGTLYDEAPMDMIIAVGFGYAAVHKDGNAIYNENDAESLNEKIWTVKDAEEIAAKDPDHDWRIILDGALRGRTFQRQDVGKWLLVDENEGFA